jgi:hypothetical protein
MNLPDLQRRWDLPTEEDARTLALFLECTPEPGDEVTAVLPFDGYIRVTLQSPASVLTYDQFDNGDTALISEVPLP